MNTLRSFKRRRGATMVLVVILLPVLLILAGFAINLSYLQLIQTKTQIATDAAASAAGKVFAISNNKNAAILAAQTAANRNPIGSNILPLQASDFEFGIATRTNIASPYNFSQAANGNAVRLTTHSLANGVGPAIDPVFPLFGSVIQFRPLRQTTCAQLELDIGLIIDRSGSMAYSSYEIAMYPPTPMNAPPGWAFGNAVPPQARWLDAIASVQAFVSHLQTTPQNENISLSIYNHQVSTAQPLTANYPLIINQLTTISQNFIAGGTNIGDGILEGLGAVGDPAFSRAWATPVLILLTDGVHNYGTNPIKAAYAAQGQKVTIFTLTFSDEAEQSLMEQVANITGGHHYHAVNAAQLQAAFRDIAGRLPTLITR